MEMLAGVVALIVLISLIANFSSLSKKGKDKWSSYRGTGKGMMDDFDAERKDIDNLMK